MQNALNTTSYAVLGLLNLKSWTAYELAAEMKHCFGYFWPRADSRSYAEAERLVAQGLAEAKREFVGKRPRTTYSITLTGREALEEWLGSPFKAFTLEFEGLIRVFLARSGSREQLLITLDRVEEEAEALLNFAAAASQAYYECRAPFQEEQVHVRAFVFTIMVPFAKAMQRWAERTRAEVETWRDLSPEGKADRAIEIIREAWME
jgi:DNA-binding PadR family transcriptional regulator